MSEPTAAQAPVDGNPFTAPAKRGPGRPPGSGAKKRSHHKKPTSPANPNRDVPPKPPGGARGVDANEVYAGTSIIVGLLSGAANIAVPRAFGPDSWVPEDRL